MGDFQGRHALIFAAAPETEYGYIRAFLDEHPDALSACADGGLRHARALGLHPDFMIADCDSSPEIEGCLLYTSHGVQVLCVGSERSETPSVRGRNP